MLSSEFLNLLILKRIHLFQQNIRAAIIPPAAFVAVPRLPPPPFETHLLPSVGTPTLHYSDSDDDNKDTGSLRDYQQQTITSSSVLLQRSHNGCSHQTTQTM